MFHFYGLTGSEHSKMIPEPALLHGDGEDLGMPK
jgi:hypothetical protein